VGQPAPNHFVRVNVFVLRTRVCAAVCTELRGDSCYLFGLRVAEEARGNGVGATLMVGRDRPGAVPHVVAGVMGSGWGSGRMLTSVTDCCWWWQCPLTPHWLRACCMCINRLQVLRSCCSPLQHHLVADQPRCCTAAGRWLPPWLLPRRPHPAHPQHYHPTQHPVSACHRAVRLHPQPHSGAMASRTFAVGL
jgi:hypothetical protein